MVIEDLEGTINAVAFPNTWKAYSDEIENGMIALVHGSVSNDSRKKTKQIVINRILDLNNIDKLIDTVEVVIQECDIDNQEKLELLQQIAKDHQGKKNLVLHLKTTNYGTVIARSSGDYKMDYSPKIVNKIEELFGKGCVIPTNRNKRAENFIEF